MSIKEDRELHGYKVKKARSKGKSSIVGARYDNNWNIKDYNVEDNTYILVNNSGSHQKAIEVLRYD